MLSNMTAGLQPAASCGTSVPKVEAILALALARNHLTYELNQVIIVQMKQEQVKQLSIRFPLALYEQIDRMAREGDRSYNAQVIRLLRERLDATEPKPKGRK